jgi:transcriptional regulator GlxA family with amidase domain
MDISGSGDQHFRVGLLLIDGFSLMSYASVEEPLRAANALAGRDLFRVRNISASGNSTTSSCGAVLPAGGSVGVDTDFDLLLVVAAGDPLSFADEQVFRWLRVLSRRGVRLGGVSGGPVILASAGLMDQRRMTVHWEHAPALIECSPALLVERNLYVMDRDRVTCAGGTAALDLMHALIAEQYGPDLARRASDWLLHTQIRPAGGPQRAGRVERYHTTDRSILNTIESMENHIADPLELGQLARVSGVSTRQLNRLFREKLGQSTMRFYSDLRLEKARNLLLNSTLSLTEIALATGFSNSAHFSTTHSKKYGEPPSALRT